MNCTSRCHLRARVKDDKIYTDEGAARDLAVLHDLGGSELLFLFHTPQYGPKACGFYSFTGNLSKLSWEAPTRFAGTYGATAFDIEGIMGDHGATMGMTLCFGQGRGAHDTRDYMNSNMVEQALL